MVDVAEVYQWCCLEESGQCLEYANCSHLVLASSKLVLQKKFCPCLVAINDILILEMPIAMESFQLGSSCSGRMSWGHK